MVLLAHVRAAFRRSRESYGAERVHHELAENGIEVGRHRVARLMRGNGLSPKRKQKFKKTTDSQHNKAVASNLLDQNFSAEAPNEKWAADISYIWTAQGWLYLAVMLDLYSRRVIGWAVGARMTSDLPLRAVAPINPICRRNPSIPGLCRIASPTCARPFELSLPWSVRLSSAARRCILRTLPCDSRLAALDRKGARPSLRMADRLFWVVLSRLWSGWREILVIVKPETVIGWHRKGFRRFWTRKSRRGKPGRPPVSSEFRGLIRRMSRENPLWGAPRIHGELRMLGFEVSEAAVSKYMPRHPKPPSQTWRTFLENHVGCLASTDFFVVPTATFSLLFVLVVLRHERRRIVHIGTTAHPTAAWVAQQIREAFPWETAPRYMIRDRDRVYGIAFRSRIKAMGIEEVVTAPRSPWQSPYVERVIGSIRRECLDHVIVLNERHLRAILLSYIDYYQRSRTHLALGKDTPERRSVQPAGAGKIVAFPQVGGLHHRYQRLAA